MTSFFRTVSLTAMVCAVSGSVMAAPVTAPGPEIGEGAIGAAVAMVVLLAFVMLPRLKRLRQSKE
jgi:hypothetical protein